MRITASDKEALEILALVVAVFVLILAFAGKKR